MIFFSKLASFDVQALGLWLGVTWWQLCRWCVYTLGWVCVCVPVSVSCRVCSCISGAVCVCLCVLTWVFWMLAKEFILCLLLGMCVYFHFLICVCVCVFICVSQFLGVANISLFLCGRKKRWVHSYPHWVKWSHTHDISSLCVFLPLSCNSGKKKWEKRHGDIRGIFGGPDHMFIHSTL